MGAGVCHLAKGKLSVDEKIVTLSSHSSARTVECVKVTLQDTVTVPADSKMEVKSDDTNISPICMARALVSNKTIVCH